MVPAALLAAQRAAGKDSPATTSSVGGTESPGTESVPPLAIVVGSGLPMVVSSPLHDESTTTRATTARAAVLRRDMEREPTNGSELTGSEAVLYGASASNRASTLAVPTPNTVAGTRNEAELHPRCRVVGGEELLVTVGIHHHVGQQRRAGFAEAGTGVAGIEHLDRDVLHAGTASAEVARDRRRCLGADEHERDATGRQRRHPWPRVGQRELVEPESVLHRFGGRGEIGDGNHDVVDACRHGVEPRPFALRRKLARRRIRPVASDLDSVGLGEQHSEQLLGEVGIDAGFDGLLAARGDHVAYSRRLDDRGVGSLLDRCDVATDREPFGHDGYERSIEVIDASAQIVEVPAGRVLAVDVRGGRVRGRWFGHRLHRTPVSPVVAAAKRANASQSVATTTAAPV